MLVQVVDHEELTWWGARVQALMAGVEGIEDLRVEAVTGLPQLRVSIDRHAVARTGLTPGDVVRALRVGLVGDEVSEVWIGQRRYDLVVRLADTARNSVSAIRSLRLQSHDGTSVPIDQVARVEEVLAPGTIRCEGGNRRVAVEASVAGRDLGAPPPRSASGSRPCNFHPDTSSRSAAASNSRSAPANRSPSRSWRR